MSETNGDVKYLTETLEHVLNQLNYIVNRVDMYGDRSALDIETVKHLKDEIEIDWSTDEELKRELKKALKEVSEAIF